MVVVGAGHAGCEAALAAARLGAKTLLLTLNLDRIAWQPCNPAVSAAALACSWCTDIKHATARAGPLMRCSSPCSGPFALLLPDVTLRATLNLLPKSAASFVCSGGRPRQEPAGARGGRAGRRDWQDGRPLVGVVQ